MRPPPTLLSDRLISIAYPLSIFGLGTRGRTGERIWTYDTMTIGRTALAGERRGVGSYIKRGTMRMERQFDRGISVVHSTISRDYPSSQHPQTRGYCRCQRGSSGQVSNRSRGTSNGESNFSSILSTILSVSLSSKIIVCMSLPAIVTMRDRIFIY